jgi:arylsulfatase A-like enzyme
MPETVILVTVDSLRADRVGITTPSHRPDRGLTPNLDAFGKHGTTCAQAFATGPGTRLSFPGILTSTTPLAFGGYNYLSEDRPKLAERIRECGFTTGAFHSNAQLSPEFGYDRGFDVFDGRLGNLSGGGTPEMDETADGYDSPGSTSLSAKVRNAVGDRLFEYPRLYQYVKDLDALVNGFSQPYATATETREAGVSWLRKQDGDVFCWLHFMDPHVPYFPPERFQREVGFEPLSKVRIANIWYKLNGRPEAISTSERETLERLYDAAVRYFDHEFGQVVDALNEMGRGDAMVAFTSDHGDEFHDHGGLTHSPQLYNELVHVPLLFENVLDGDTITDPVSLLDIAPTLTAAAGGSLAEYWGQALRSDPPDADRTVFSEVSHAPEAPRQEVRFENRIIACRDGRFTFVDDYLRDRTELYDRVDDPNEQRPCGDQFPEKRDEMADNVAIHWEKVAGTSPELLERTMSDDVKSRLKDLGYL